MQFHPLLQVRLNQYIEQQSAPVSYVQLCQDMAIQGLEAEAELQACLTHMQAEGEILLNRNNEYATPAMEGLFVGEVIGHRDGFGFLKLPYGNKDLYIPNSQMHLVLHGDRVLAKLSSRESRGRKEAKIIRVLKPRNQPIVGRFYKEHGLGFVIPDDSRINQEIVIEEADNKGARNGHMVVVEIKSRPSRSRNASGVISEVLGEHMAPGMEIEVAMRKYEIPHEWPKAVTNYVEKLSDEVPESAKSNRVDLRDLPLVTIDGEDARDFDDAVYCEKKAAGGWRLWVAIADVSSYVKKGSALDNEAELRGTSVYFPEQVVPMLPEKLSNGLCSINPQVDRLCMVCEMTISARGRLSGYQFYQAVMRSHARLTYTKVDRMLRGDEALIERYQSLHPHIVELHNMYQALKKMRSERGAIEFETPEAKFIFNAQRKIESVELVVRNDAHKIIEECMIQANVSAARFLEKNNAQALFRTHDAPGEEKLSQLVGFLAELGIEVPFNKAVKPADLKAIADKIQGRPDQELIETMILRSMKQAIYSSENSGHFGLALPAYAHFTSPIRRYPDLVVHRAIKSVLKKQGALAKKSGEYAYSEEEVDELGIHTSMTERRADEATRDVASWLKCEFMQDHIGEVYMGTVSAVTSFGFFVRLDELFIEGLVHVSNLNKDFYIYDATKHRLIGEHKRKVYKLGDRLKVQVASVNLEDKKIDFNLMDGDSAPGDQQQKQKPAKTTRGSKTQQMMEAEPKTAPKGVSGKKKRSKNKPKAAKKAARKSNKPSRAARKKANK
ncbi:ribonuclease R [Gayadomonas joobiniege]|uniref:ribonuclease R n=1 Tax=Gayadomonas joobiniege TaxID=1234606 RepID=UPI0003710656|nr:ribonuclease R [Gayadomonas joobiniege]